MKAQLCEAHEQEVENLLLRHVFELIRTIRRFNGIDQARVKTAWDKLEGAVEEVLEFDAGTMDDELKLTRLFGDSTISQVYMLCDAYESGYGHGLQLDRHDNELNDLYADPRHNEAYKLGYRKGQRLSNRQNPTSPEAIRNEGDRVTVGRYLLKTPMPETVLAVAGDSEELPLKLDSTTIALYAQVAKQRGVTVAQVITQVLEHCTVGEITAAAQRLQNPAS